MTSGVQIHPTAVIDRDVRLGADVRVGPFSVIEAGVALGDRCVVHPHVVLAGDTELGADVEVFPQAVVGMRPQDLRSGEPGRLRIGPRTVIREGVTLHPGSRGDERLTTIGADALIMAYCHVAHDCRVGDRVIMANATQIAGHCIIEEGAVLGGATTVHQRCRVGTLAMTGASSRIQLDVPPYCIADGNPARLYGLNVVGLKRDGRPEAAVVALKRAYRRLFRESRYAATLAELAAAPSCDEVAALCDFIGRSERGVTRSRRRR